jgi:hypothetical protein
MKFLKHIEMCSGEQLQSNCFSRGDITLLVLVYGAIFLGVIVALAGATLAGNRAADTTFERMEARSIAEAGLQEYRYALDQGASPDVAAQSSSYSNLESVVIGTYTLNAQPDALACGTSSAYQVSSLGVPSDAPAVKVTLSACVIPPTPTASTSPLFYWREQ